MSQQMENHVEITFDTAIEFSWMRIAYVEQLPATAQNRFYQSTAVLDLLVPEFSALIHYQQAR